MSRCVLLKCQGSELDPRSCLHHSFRNKAALSRHLHMVPLLLFDGKCCIHVPRRSNHVHTHSWGVTLKGRFKKSFFLQEAAIVVVQLVDTFLHWRGDFSTPCKFWGPMGGNQVPPPSLLQGFPASRLAPGEWERTVLNFHHCSALRIAKNGNKTATGFHFAYAFSNGFSWQKGMAYVEHPRKGVHNGVAFEFHWAM